VTDGQCDYIVPKFRPETPNSNARVKRPNDVLRNAARARRSIACTRALLEQRTSLRRRREHQGDGVLGDDSARVAMIGLSYTTLLSRPIVLTTTRLAITSFRRAAVGINLDGGHGQLA
jgi:hypothetical protein